VNLLATVTARPDRVEAQLHAAADVRRAVRPVRLLIVFNTVYLYGMERQVIELFDLLRPEVEPHFLLSFTIYRQQLPLLAEIERRGLEHSFFSDRREWPMLGRPRSLRQSWQMAMAMLKGNRDVLRQSLNCDAIYLPAIGYGYFALVAVAYCRLGGKRVIFEFHDLPRRRQLRLRLLSMVATDCIHHTRAGYDFSVGTNPYIARKKTFICPGRTQSSRLGNPDPQVRRALEGRRNLLFVGRVTRNKGIDLLLEAFASLAEDYRDVNLHVLGGCDEEPEWRQTVSAHGLDARVYFWGYRDDVLDFLRLTYLYVHPSPPSRVMESFGRGVVEAMSQGVPAVCFRSGALGEIVLHQQTGLVCGEETVACLASNIRRFLDDRGLRSSCAEVALSRFQQLYFDDAIRTRWLRFLREEGGHQC